MNKIGALSYGLHTVMLLLTQLRAYRTIHVQNIDTPLIVGILARLFLRRTLVATIHGEAKLVFQRDRGILGHLRLWLMRRTVHAFTALTESVRRELVSLGVRESRIHSIPNGVDVAFFRPPSLRERDDARQALGLSNRDIAAVFVGRLVPLKQVDQIIKMWSEVRFDDGRMLIIGEGPERRGLQELVADCRVENVRFYGATSDVRRFLWAGDVFLLFSEREGLPMALLEAMATGLAPIVSAVPGIQSLVSDGRNGFLVPGNRTDLYKERLVKLMSSPELRAELGRAAYQTVVEGYSLTAIARAHARVYRSLRRALA